MYTPLEIGFWRDPNLLELAEKVKYPDVGAAIARLREFVLTMGTNEGTLPGRTLGQIAVVMESNRAGCSRKTFFKALAEAGYLKCRRKTYYYPNWKQTPMGQYCKERKENADHQAALRRKKKELAIQALVEEQQKGTSGVRTGDVGSSSVGDLEDSNLGRPADAQNAPSGGAGGEALTRWEWFKNLHPRPDNPALCKRLLAALSQEEWEQLQFALPTHAMRAKGRDTRRVALGSKYLRNGLYWELKKDTRPKAGAKAKAEKVNPEPSEAETKAYCYRRLMDALMDPDRPEKLKEKDKQHWLEKYPDERPWEDHQEHAQKAKAA